MYEFADGQPLDLDKLRSRLAKMSDDELKKFGASARYMCSPKANLGKPPMESNVVQLRRSLMRDSPTRQRGVPAIPCERKLSRPSAQRNRHLQFIRVVTSLR
jgi:hypothetical protein